MKYETVKVIDAGDIIPDDICDDVADYYEASDGSYKRLYHNKKYNHEFMKTLQNILNEKVPPVSVANEYEYVLLHFSW